MRQLRGFLPWIAFPAAATVLDWRLAAALAFAVALAGSARRHADTFGVAAMVFFGGLTVVAFADPTSAIHHFVPALTPATLALAAAVSIAVRRPFTMPFAKRVAPREFWETPMFMHINVVLSAVWATSFAAMAAVNAVVLSMHPQATAVLIGAQIAGFVIPMRICRSYPATVRARLASA
jgi:intracellular septation protein A